MMFSNEVGPINLGNPYNELTMIELKTLLENITKQKLEIEYEQLPENDPKQRKPNITLAKEKLDWNPVVSIEYGFKRTLEYFDKLLV